MRRIGEEQKRLQDEARRRAEEEAKMRAFQTQAALLEKQKHDAEAARLFAEQQKQDLANQQYLLDQQQLQWQQQQQLLAQQQQNYSETTTTTTYYIPQEPQYLTTTYTSGYTDPYAYGYTPPVVATVPTAYVTPGYEVHAAYPTPAYTTTPAYVPPPTTYTPATAYPPSTNYPLTPPVQTPTMYAATNFPIPKLIVTIKEGRNLVKKDFGGLGKSDPFAVVDIRGMRYQTRHQNNTQAPVWGETFEFQQVQATDVLTIGVYDYERIGTNKFMGEAHIRGTDLLVVGDKWHRLLPRQGVHDRVDGDILVKLFPSAY